MIIFKIQMILIFLMSGWASEAQWLKTNGPSGAGNISSLAIKGNNIFAGTVSGGVYLSSDKGASWNAKNNGLSNLGDIRSLAISDSFVFAGANNSGNAGVFSTGNNAGSWSARGLPFTYLFSLAAKPSFLIAGTWFGVSVTTNSGISWTEYTAGLPSNATVSSLAFEGNKIFCGVSGSSVGGTGVFRSLTNGMSWTSYNTGLSATIVNKVAVMGTNVFAGTNGGVFISNSTTAGWVAINNGLTNTSVRSFCVVGNNLFAGTADGIFLTINKGISWTSVSTGLPANTNIYSITSDGTDLYIGADTVVWRRSLTQMSLNGIEESLTENESVKIYPNPVHSNASVHISTPAKNASLNIYNLYGEKVKTIENISEKEIELSINNLPAGIYFIAFRQDDKIITTSKIIITD